MASLSNLFVVIPAYNEASTIADVVRRAMAVAPNVVVVDDGSTDETVARLADLDVRLIRHQGNQGKGAALLDGFRMALEQGAGAVVTMDGDGQHAPENIPDLVARSSAHPGRIVIGSRLHDRAAFPPSRYRANRIANFWISWASGHRIADSQCGMRLYPRVVLKAVCAKARHHQGFVFESEVLIDAAAAGFPTTSVPIPALYDGHTQRPSHFRPVRDIAAIVVMVAGKLLARGMYPAGLIASLRQAPDDDR